MPHIPVLKKEVLSFLRKSDCNIADLTAGLGGHSCLFLQKNQNLKLFLVDRDAEALRECRKNLLPNITKKDSFQKNTTEKNALFFFENNFYSQSEHWKKEQRKFDFIFADLGVSSLQLDNAERGFSFLKEGALDMRMDVAQTLDAKKILQSYDEKKLAQIFRDYGEERYAKYLAEKIVRRREEKPFLTTTDLSFFTAQNIKSRQNIKSKKNTKSRKSPKTKIHPATKIFQAIRIEVNQELKQLEAMLSVVLDLLQPKARLIIISFHSLEDRIVKQKFKSWAEPASKTPFPLPAVEEKPLVRLLCKKPIVPEFQEIQANPRSRSAKMRVIEKI